MNNTVKKRLKSGDWVSMHRNIFTDMNLTGDSIRVLGYLLGKPDGWVIRETDIRNQFAPIGKEKASNHFFRKVIKNLQDAGYIKKVAHRNELGHIVSWETIIADEPAFLEQRPDVEKPTCGEHPDVEKPTCGEFTPLSNKDTLLKKNTTEKNTTTPPYPPQGFEDEIESEPKRILSVMWLKHIGKALDSIPIHELEDCFFAPAARLLDAFDEDIRAAFTALVATNKRMTDDEIYAVRLSEPVRQTIQAKKRAERKPATRSHNKSAAELALAAAFG